jgi:5-methylcytosine-specific restriction endonuclease McrA
MSDEDSYYILDPAQADPKRIKKEREKARELRKTSWWKNKIAQGICHYCGEKFAPAELTMDHVVPLARGGSSTTCWW